MLHSGLNLVEDLVREGLQDRVLELLSRNLITKSTEMRGGIRHMRPGLLGLPLGKAHTLLGSGPSSVVLRLSGFAEVRRGTTASLIESGSLVGLSSLLATLLAALLAALLTSLFAALLASLLAASLVLFIFRITLRTRESGRSLNAPSRRTRRTGGAHSALWTTFTRWATQSHGTRSARWPSYSVQLLGTSLDVAPVTRHFLLLVQQTLQAQSVGRQSFRKLCDVLLKLRNSSCFLYRLLGSRCGIKFGWEIEDSIAVLVGLGRVGLK
mmetsp:Transcript_21088/g.33055  ORF Transcript_21088/g.33055 Transcript_21088/m.33055 type:complete len:268 (-) Transcript_21088:287-1090(-)